MRSCAGWLAFSEQRRVLAQRGQPPGGFDDEDSRRFLALLLLESVQIMGDTHAARILAALDAAPSHF